MKDSGRVQNAWLVTNCCLKEESRFDKVIDPTAGSYYIENLTVATAKRAWELFLVEEAGGFYAALKQELFRLL